MSRLPHSFLCALILGIALPAAGASFEVTPAKVVLGKDAVATVTFKGFAENPERLRAACSAGELKNLHAVGGDTVGEWSTGKQLELQPVLCALLSPSGAYAFGIIPLVHKETLTLTGLPPLSRVEVDVGAEHFGPARADGAGRVELQISRGPGDDVASVRAIPPTGAEVQLKQPLSKSAVDQTLLFTTPGQLVADGQSPLTVHAFATTGAALLEDGALTAQTPDGPISLRRAAPGVFIGTWTPSPRAAEEDAPLSIRGRRLKVKLSAGIRASASLHVKEPVLPADGLSMTVVIARLTDSNGKPLPQQPLRMTTDRGQVGQVTDRGDGTYVALYTAPVGQASMVRLKVELGGQVVAETSLRLVQGPGLTMEPLDPMLRADGQAQTIVRISARDPNGRPLPDGTAVKLLATAGELRESVALKDGRADVPFKAGTKAGTAVLTASIGELSQSSVVQLVGGEPSKVELTAEPSIISCLQQSTLRVTVKDRFGNDVPEADVQLKAERGELSALEARNAAFFSRLTPVCLDHVEDVTVTAAVGDVRASTKVQVTPSHFDLGLRAALGVQTDLSKQTLGTVGLELDTPLPRLALLRLGIEVDAAGGSHDGRRSALFSLYLGPTLRLAQGERFWLRIGGGLDGHFAAVESQSGLLFGMHARAQGGFRVGPGSVVLQLRGTIPLTVGQDVPSAAGADLSAGYRVEL